MVTLNKIYTRTGDDGTTALADGSRVPKEDLRIEAYGTVDEANSSLGVARTHLANLAWLDHMLERVQNDLFDLGADLATPIADDLGWEPLRIIDSQVDRLEDEIDALNAELGPLKSFVLPAGHPGAAALHLSRTITRRAERLAVRLGREAEINPAAVKYLNRLSDMLFVAARFTNLKLGAGDVLWKPGENR